VFEPAEEPASTQLSERERFLANRERLREIHKKRKWAKGTVALVQLRERERSCSSCVLRNKKSIRSALAWFKKRKEKKKEKRVVPQNPSSSSTALASGNQRTLRIFTADNDSRITGIFLSPSPSAEREREEPQQSRGVRRVSISPSPSPIRGLSQLPKRRGNGGKRRKR